MTTNSTTKQTGELEACPWCRQAPEVISEPEKPMFAVICSSSSCPVRRAGWVSPEFWNTSRAAVATPASVVNFEAWTSIDRWLRENPKATAAECLAELIKRVKVEAVATPPVDAEVVAKEIADYLFTNNFGDRGRSSQSLSQWRCLPWRME